jgi:Protein of unknown function (DUF3455)
MRSPLRSIAWASTAWASTLAGALGASAPAVAQAVPTPQVPDAIRAPAGERVVLAAHATGSQIYVCTAGSDGKPQWTLKAPDADLRDAQGGAAVIHHSAGPTWSHRDGSAVIGKATAKAPAPNPDSIPWLLVSVTEHRGSGVLASVTHIQRINTVGGQPPPASQCSDANRNAEMRSSYSADYYFYAPTGAPQGSGDR